LRWVGVGDSWVVRPCLAITPDFVRLNRWSFPTRCIGILNLTGGSVIDEWGPALLDAGYKMEQSGALRNMPVVPDKSTARARLNGEGADLQGVVVAGLVGVRLLG
jgi:hypothetical protein